MVSGTQRGSGGQIATKMKAEIGVIPHKPEKGQGLPASTGSQERHGTDSVSARRRDRPRPPRAPRSGSHNHVRVSFCCFPPSLALRDGGSRTDTHPLNRVRGSKAPPSKCHCVTSFCLASFEGIFKGSPMQSEQLGKFY